MLDGLATMGLAGAFATARPASDAHCYGTARNADGWKPSSTSPTGTASMPCAPAHLPTRRWDLPGQYIGANGVRIAQMPCDSSVSAQVWEAEPAGHSSDGQYLYYIVNYYDPNNRECLDVTDANPNDKAPIQQWFCNGGGSEKWMKGSVSFGGEQYVNARTGKCLDVPYASYSPVYIWQYHCTSPNAAQAFNWPGTGL